MPLSGGTPSILAGQAGVYGFADGQGIAAKFNGQQGLVVHPFTGVVYIADTSNGRIRTCTPSGLVSTLASGVTGAAVGIVMDRAAVYIYVACFNSNQLLQFAVSTGSRVNFAGSGAYSSIDGQLLGASFSHPK